MNKPRAFAPDEIFLQPGQACRLDYNWGFIQNYLWYNDENIDRIKKLIPIFPDEKEFLETLTRRIKYFQSLNWELNYLSERYDWNKFDGVQEVFICRFEHFICYITESIMYVLQFYTRNKKSYNGITIDKFEDIGKFFVDNNNGLPAYHNKSINDSALLSILLFIRNSLVHRYKDIQYKTNKQNPIIESPNIPPKKRYGVIPRLYVDDIFSQYTGKKIPCNFVSSPFNDNRFYLQTTIKLNKQCTIDYDETIMSFSVETLELTNRLCKNEFFVLFREVFHVLIEENKKA